MAYSDLVAQAIVAAAREQQLPEGVFSMLNGNTNALGAALVADPRIKAVGFTGSRAGGLALMKIAGERPEPIPVYAEMSSINPVLLLPAALAMRAEALGREFVASLTLGVGQFCTSPGVIIALEGTDLDRFIASASATLRDVAPAVMLTPATHDSYETALAKLAAHASVATIARGADMNGRNCGRAALLSLAASEVIDQSHFLEEVFGPAAIIVRCVSPAQIAAVLERLEGQLTATLHVGSDDEALAAQLLPILERKAGRLVANGWPTGVEVAHAMVHGGPFPATSDGRSTSVGTLAIERFLRPVCYQDFPNDLLPAELQ